jgi:hypothetical protein
MIRWMVEFDIDLVFFLTKKKHSFLQGSEFGTSPSQIMQIPLYHFLFYNFNSGKKKLYYNAIYPVV